ncbi:MULTISPECIES: Dps family protein [unclassified Paenibacillus]|uniref:Dps family protein n=1 Tax=unclassified Paenibacillus TaxID=185978 RepID=UPI000957277D|nr:MULTISPECIES: Dps family protein [unclassified Paenibacillus]ASS67122.1 DNA starvation/stationary phase protection protein [Paenibacillus sp. RUD330]SIQ89273.1 starvation-inducible DNA-binding protein [Paenibacillus sp. RU4X]SIR10133.1 starvation-inducible DNA-binding protein [Paenibacillus sp. RU4T]
MTASSAAAVPSVAQVLNLQLANWSILYVKLHQYHWYVKGPQFFTLHEKFQALYEEAAIHVDELAERLLAVGGRPLASMKAYLETATVQEAAGSESAIAMVRSVSADFRSMIGELKEGMAAAQSRQDETTADMLLAIHTSLEKHVWMLDAFTAE